jgi:hypothetical protein
MRDDRTSATYTIRATDEARELLSPMKVGDETSIPLSRIGGGPFDMKAVTGRVVSVDDDGYSAVIEYVPEAGWEAI